MKPLKPKEGKAFKVAYNRFANTMHSRRFSHRTDRRSLANDIKLAIQHLWEETSD